MDMAVVDMVTMNTAIKYTNTKDLMTASMVFKGTIIKIEYIVTIKCIHRTRGHCGNNQIESLIQLRVFSLIFRSSMTSQRLILNLRSSAKQSIDLVRPCFIRDHVHHLSFGTGLALNRSDDHHKSIKLNHHNP